MSSSDRLPPVPGGIDADGLVYDSAEVLVRLHDRPLGVVRVNLTNDVARHLEQDGVEGLDRLPLDGLPQSHRRVLPDDGDMPLSRSLS